MIHFNYDTYNQMTAPNIYLAYPNKKLIGILKASARQCDFYFNARSILSFTIYKHTNGIPTKYYDEIALGRYLYLEGITWFRITSLKKSDTGDTESISVEGYTLDSELSNTYITDMGSMGVNEDEQGGLDLYCLNNPQDPDHSIRDLIEAKNPSWTFSYIDSAISHDYRSYKESRISSYDLLTQKVAEALECVFLFDSNSKSISVYKLENIGKRTAIYLSYRNLIKSLDITWNEDDVRTVFYVTGGDDVTGTPLLISDVNPTGNNYISDFSYYYKDMSEELRGRLQEYNKKVSDNQSLCQNALTQLQTLYGELAALYDAHPSDEASTVWSEYGLNQLKSKSSSYNDLMSTYVDKIAIDPVAKTNYDQYTSLYNAVEKEISKRESQISEKNQLIKAQTSKVLSYVIDLESFLGRQLYKELSVFQKEELYNDTSFIATESMSDSEILEMKKELLDHAYTELQRVSQPRFEMTVDAINFPAIFKYKKYTDQLDLGNIVYIHYSDDITIPARVLKIHYNFDDASDFNMTFSNSTSLEDGYFEFGDIMNMAESMSKELDLKYVGWNSANNKANKLQYLSMQEFMDASMKAITNNAIDQEVLMNSAGILLRKKIDSGYAPDKLWLTSANILLYSDTDGTQLKTPHVAIGKVNFQKNGAWHTEYGVAADVLYGHLLWGESLFLTNQNNTMLFDENGMTAKATNGFSVTINPDNPSSIFTIAENTNKLLYVDASKKKLVFKGMLEADEGHVGGWTIQPNRLYSGKTGMSSDTTSGAIAFWAGNITPASAPFRIDNNGNGWASSLHITGGSLKIGDKFSVDTLGIVNAVDGTFTGTINARNGTIGNWVLQDNKLIGSENSIISGGIISGSHVDGGYIVGAEIDIGNGFYRAYDTHIDIGDFYCENDEYGRSVFQAFDQTTGISAEPRNNGGLFLWAGWYDDSDYTFVVNNKKEVRIKGSLFVNGKNITGSGSGDLGNIDSMELFYGSDSDPAYDYDWLQIYTTNSDEYHPDKEYWWVKGGWYSDRKLKNTILPADVNALDLINRIPHKQFNFNKTGNHYNVGYIAQELEEICSQWVDVHHGEYSINEYSLIPYITKALQELSCKVEKLLRTDF